MKPISKLLIIVAISATACKKENTNGPLTSSTTSSTASTSSTSSIPDNYASIADFFSQNGVAMQTYIVDGTLGGSFTSPQGTLVTIPANAFRTQSDDAVTGTVTIQFKDIFKKSDMLLSNIPTVTSWGTPLKSGGEFFIKAIANGSELKIAPDKKIEVNMPAALSGGLDNNNTQSAWVLSNNMDSTVKDTSGWEPNPDDSIFYIGSSYVYKLYQLTGSWYNSDNSTFFAAYPQVNLILSPADDVVTYRTNVFLVFESINTVIPLYYNSTAFIYQYAPQGLKCTAVAMGVKEGKLYSAFVPINITSGMTVNFTLTQTTTDAFKAQLDALN